MKGGGIMRRNIVAIPVGAALLSMQAPSSVAAQKYTKPPLAVVPASRVLVVPAPAQAPYRLGQELVFIKQPTFPNEAVRKIMTAGFEVRFFRTSGPTGMPKPWLMNQDDCDVFLTLLVKGLKFSRRRISLGGLGSQHWLNRSRDGYLEAGHFLAVIEQATPDDPPSTRDRWQVFRLTKAAQRAYFNQGFRIQVDPQPTSEGRPLSRPSEEARMKQLLAAVAKEISTRFNCYQARAIAQAEQPALPASGQPIVLAACRAVSPVGAL